MLRAAIVIGACAFASAGTPILETCPGVLFLSAAEEGKTSTANDMLPGKCLGEPRHLKWANVNSVGLGCWDANLEFGTIGTPGGDFAGELDALHLPPPLSFPPCYQMRKSVAAMLLTAMP